MLKRFVFVCLALTLYAASALAQQASPTITITTATATSSTFSTAGVRQIGIQWKFGTVAGSFTSCTAQVETTFNGTNFLTLGDAQSITVTTTTLNAWTLTEPLGTTTSSTVSNSFGLLSRFTFACSGYGTSAPVSINVTLGANTGAGTVTLSATDSGNLQIIADNSSSEEPTDTHPQAKANGGCTWSKAISSGAVLKTQLCATACQIYKLVAASKDTTPVWIKGYNLLAADTDENDTPLFVFGVPAAPTNDMSELVIGSEDVGAEFSVALTYRVTTGILDNDTGALTANEVVVSACVKQ
jgi:hypothetical protein